MTRISMVMPTRSGMAVEMKAPWQLTTSVSPSQFRGSATPCASIATLRRTRVLLRRSRARSEGISHLPMRRQWMDCWIRVEIIHAADTERKNGTHQTIRLESRWNGAQNAGLTTSLQYSCYGGHHEQRIRGGISPVRPPLSSEVDVRRTDGFRRDRRPTHW